MSKKQFELHNADITMISYATQPILHCGNPQHTIFLLNILTNVLMEFVTMVIII